MDLSDLNVPIYVNARRQDHVLSLGFCILKEGNFGLELYISDTPNESFWVARGGSVFYAHKKSLLFMYLFQ